MLDTIYTCTDQPTIRRSSIPLMNYQPLRVGEVNAHYSIAASPLYDQLFVEIVASHQLQRTEPLVLDPQSE